MSRQGADHQNAHQQNGREPRAAEYPLLEHDDGSLRAASGRALNTIDLETIHQDLAAGDLQISAETLHAQADVAEKAGYRELAENLRRAAELSAVPNDELLRMYEQLRPSRSSYEELTALADRLASAYSAHTTAAFVREAAAVYRRRNLLRKEDASATSR